FFTGKPLPSGVNFYTLLILTLKIDWYDLLIFVIHRNGDSLYRYQQQTSCPHAVCLRQSIQMFECTNKRFFYRIFCQMMGMQDIICFSNQYPIVLTKNRCEFFLLLLTVCHEKQHSALPRFLFRLTFS